MVTIADVARFLEEFAPSRLAAEWDNVGLLVGDPSRSVKRIMTCLTVTPASAQEAISREADLIVAHHPLPFRPLQRMTTETTEGRLLLDLIAAGVAIYSPHTAFDSAAQGINQLWAEGLAITKTAPLVLAADGDGGAGRWGKLAQPQTLEQLAQRVKKFLGLDRAQLVGSPEQRVTTVAVACGSAGELLAAAIEAGCDCMVTGEVRFHTALEAEAAGVGIVLAGHFASERFGVVKLADVLANQFGGVETWAAQQERDPVKFV